MSNPHENFGHFLREQRTRLGWSTAKVEETAHLGSGSLAKYEQGSRVPKDDAPRRLKEVLCESPELQAIFDQLLVNAQETHHHESPLTLPLGSRKASYRVIPVPYPPFSGDDHCFVDWLIKRMFELAGFRYEIAEDFRDKIDRGVFNLKERIDALKSHKADLLINLASLERARALTFLLTPIRVSVNAVMLRKKSQELSAARSLLALGSSPTAVTFRILAIPNEVGWVHVTRTLKVPESEIERLTTLNTRKLAEALTRSAWHPEPHILVCDELTALGVLKELGQDGVMVFQLSTDESITQSDKRRRLPAHPLGIGVERNDATTARPTVIWKRPSRYSCLLRMRVWLQLIESCIGNWSRAQQSASHAMRVCTLAECDVCQ